jgi:hypothetical protein
VEFSSHNVNRLHFAIGCGQLLRPLVLFTAGMQAYQHGVYNLPAILDLMSFSLVVLCTFPSSSSSSSSTMDSVFNSPPPSLILNPPSRPCTSHDTPTPSTNIASDRNSARSLSTHGLFSSRIRFPLLLPPFPLTTQTASSASSQYFYTFPRAFTIPETPPPTDDHSWSSGRSLQGGLRMISGNLICSVEVDGMVGSV